MRKIFLCSLLCLTISLTACGTKVVNNDSSSEVQVNSEEFEDDDLDEYDDYEDEDFDESDLINSDGVVQPEDWDTAWEYFGDQYNTLYNSTTDTCDYVNAIRDDFLEYSGYNMDVWEEKDIDRNLMRGFKLDYDEMNELIDIDGVVDNMCSLSYEPPERYAFGGNDKEFWLLALRLKDNVDDYEKVMSDMITTFDNKYGGRYGFFPRLSSDSIERRVIYLTDDGKVAFIVLSQKVDITNIAGEHIRENYIDDFQTVLRRLDIPVIPVYNASYNSKLEAVEVENED